MRRATAFGIVVGILSFIFPPSQIGAIGGPEEYCKVCYGVDMCLEVPDEFGWQTCTPNVIRPRVIVLFGEIRVFYIVVCEQKDRCLTAPE